jgi:hypothetical protein
MRSNVLIVESADIAIFLHRHLEAAVEASLRHGGEGEGLPREGGRWVREGEGGVRWGPLPRGDKVDSGVGAVGVG